jgi:hypothetical protein
VSDFSGDMNGAAMCDACDVVWWICAVMCNVCGVVGRSALSESLLVDLCFIVG